VLYQTALLTIMVGHLSYEVMNGRTAQAPRYIFGGRGEGNFGGKSKLVSAVPDMDIRIMDPWVGLGSRCPQAPRGPATCWQCCCMTCGCVLYVCRMSRIDFWPELQIPMSLRG